jgi:hypothetical protein
MSTPPVATLPAVPLDMLTVRDGVLCLLAPRHPPTPYLTMPPVRIAGKNNFVELGAGLVAYMFALSHGADAAWTEIVAANASGLVAEIQGAQVELRCAPAELEAGVAKLKEVLALTNRKYAEAKEQLLARVAELDQQRQAHEASTEERARVLQQQFERLKL